MNEFIIITSRSFGKTLFRELYEEYARAKRVLDADELVRKYRERQVVPNTPTQHNWTKDNQSLTKMPVQEEKAKHKRTIVTTMHLTHIVDDDDPVTPEQIMHRDANLIRQHLVNLPYGPDSVSIKRVKEF